MNQRSTDRLKPVDRIFRALGHRTLRATGGIVPAAAPNGAERWLVASEDGSGSPVSVDVHDPRFYRRLALEGTLGAGRSWIDGDWDCDDLPLLIRRVVARDGLRMGIDGVPAHVASLLRRLAAPLARNSRRGSRRNIAAHYDLGNELFERMLDPSMTYSSAVFPEPGASLEAAQFEKYDRICRRLGLTAEHEVVEIGTGWGGFALHAAQVYGSHVTTTTLSREQHAYALDRIRKADCEDRITLRLDDYRDLRGRFDRLVSIEMIEAVGASFLPGYFRTCSQLLHPTGAMSLQAIVIGDQNYEAAAGHVDFVKEYIFPGGCLPSITRMAECARDETDLRIHHIDDITADYAETLRRWRDKLDAHEDEIRSLGYDDRFLRMWRFYLAYCEAGFEERHISCIQIDFVKPQWRPEP